MVNVWDINCRGFKLTAEKVLNAVPLLTYVICGGEKEAGDTLV